MRIAPLGRLGRALTWVAPSQAKRWPQPPPIHRTRKRLTLAPAPTSGAGGDVGELAEKGRPCGVTRPPATTWAKTTRAPSDLEGPGGEEQLSQSEIQQGMDGVFGAIRRCLILAAGDEPVTGRLVLGLRIEGTGRVSRVNLSGPAAVSTGECGTCLRSAAQRARFPSFDGPAMVVRYPVTLD